MGPEDQHEQPFDQDEYEKWLDEQASKKLMKIIRDRGTEEAEEAHQKALKGKD